MCGRGGEVEGFGLITDGGKPLPQQHMLQFLQYPALAFLSLAFLSLYTSQYAAFDCNIFSGWWTAKEHTICELLLGDAHHLLDALIANTTFVGNVPQCHPA